MPNVAPAVSVITATYNRSNVLRYTIASLIRSTFTDWELLVIGDACTDDTEAVVAAFGDARIHFTNLPQNTGEQSGPNNVGMAQARGRYLAFLNHDDLWFAEHLETAVRGIEETQADLVYTLALTLAENGRPVLSGSTVSGRYEPQVRVAATQWLFRRELVDAIGPWRFSRECYAAPSQDWLFRAHLANKKLWMLPNVTVLAIPSGGRKKAYSQRDYLENQTYFAHMVNNPTLREQLLTKAAAHDSAQLYSLALMPSIRRVARVLAYRLGLRFGWSPDAIANRIRFRRKGGLIVHLRKLRGLPSQ